MVHKKLSGVLNFRFLLGICFLLNTACGAAPSNTPIPQPTCTAILPSSNPYLSHEISDGLRKIYKESPSNILGTKQNALSQLGKNTEHWSDRVDLVLNDSQMVRIVITYLDPVLIQYVMLNHVLAYSNAQEYPDAFDNEVHLVMNNLGERNEMLFIVTITTPFYVEQASNANVTMVKFPVEEMALISTADVRIYPAHEDHILDENIDITHGPVHGIVGYPIAIMNQTQCMLIMDQYTTTLTLDVPSINLGGMSQGPQFWSIPYFPLVSEDHVYPTPTVDFYFDFSRESQLATPPTPNWNSNAVDDATNWDLYWQEMGRYIWNVVITASHH